MDFPRTVQAALLFDKLNPINLSDFVKKFIAAEYFPGLVYSYGAGTNHKDFYVLVGKGFRELVFVTIELLNKPANMEVFNATLQSSWTMQLTPDAQKRLSRHKSHILIEVRHGVMPSTADSFFRDLKLPVAGNSLAEFRMRFGICSAAALLMNGIKTANLIHFTTSDVVIKGEMFFSIATLSGSALSAPNFLNIHPLLFGAGKDRHCKPMGSIKTFGAKYFVGREVHVLPSSLPVADIIRFILVFLNYAISEDGYIIPDGDVFSSEDGTCICRVRHIEENQTSGAFDGPLYQLEILHLEQRGYTAPNYVKPERAGHSPLPSGTHSLKNVCQNIIAVWSNEKNNPNHEDIEFINKIAKIKKSLFRRIFDAFLLKK